jgi:mTERF domain-containing protein, mitochondrial
MYSLLARRISASFFSPPEHHQLALLTPLLRLPFSSSTVTQPAKETPFVARYLISAFGVAPDQALEFSARKKLAAIKSVAQPESVVKLLKDTGLSDAQIKGAISSNPDVLSYNVERDLKPNLAELMTHGFSVDILAQLIRYCPGNLTMREIARRLSLCRNFVGMDDVALSKFIMRNHFMLNIDIDRYIVPKMDLLKECGLSDQDIAALFGNGHSCTRRSISYLRSIIDLIENLGVLRGSRSFLAGLKTLSNFNIDTIKKKFEFFKTAYGWSHEEVCAAFGKYPNILAMSEVRVKSNMDFLIREVKIEPSSIASVPILLGYSLKKRLIPRHRVLCILDAKKLKERCNLFDACMLPEKTFVERYIEPYKKDAPEVSDAYFAAFGGKAAA